MSERPPVRFFEKRSLFPEISFIKLKNTIGLDRVSLSDYRRLMGASIQRSFVNERKTLTTNKSDFSLIKVELADSGSMMSDLVRTSLP